MSRAGFDVAVVGAGVIGSAIAYECARRGARVVLLDRDQPGQHASGAAAGMLAPCSEAHEAGPFLDMARESLRIWPEFAAAVHEAAGVDPELHLDGLLRVALDGADANGIHARLRWQHDHGIDEGQWIDAPTAHDIEPALRPAITGAAWYPNEGHVHSRNAVRAMVAAATAKGAELRTDAHVTAPTASGLELTDGTRIDADRIILAAGAWLGDVAKSFGAALPVRPIHGQLLALTGLSETPRRVLYAGPKGYVVARQDGTVLAGATEEDRGFDTTPSPQVAANLRHTADRLLANAANAATHTQSWAGLRPAAPDHLPLLGPLPGDPTGRVIVAGAHYRNGVLLAPATARGIADLALDGRTPNGWQAFDPRRFG